MTPEIAQQIRALGCMHPYQGDLGRELASLASAIESRLMPGKAYGSGLTPEQARKAGHRLLLRRAAEGYEIDYAWMTMGHYGDDPDSIADNPFGFGDYPFTRRRVRVASAREAAEIYLRLARRSS